MDKDLHSEGDKVSNSEGVTKSGESKVNGTTVEDHTNTMSQSKNTMVATVTTIREENTEDKSERFCMESILPDGELDGDDPLLAYKAIADPDVIYLHQAMKERDRDQFIQAMRKEVNDQKENGNFVIVRKDQVPGNKTILYSKKIVPY